MPQEPFVMNSIERAQQCMELCANGTDIPRDECASMLATLCGFGTWDVMTYAIEALPPSRVDEELDEAQARERLMNYIKLLVRNHELDMGLAIPLLKHLPPSSRQPYAPFKLDSEASTAEIHGRTLAKLAQLRSDEEFECEHSVVDPFDVEHEPGRTHAALALCGQVEPVLWLTILEHLDWDVDFNGDEVPDIGEASFTVRDNVLGEVPMYPHRHTAVR